MLWIGIALVVGALVLNVISVRMRRSERAAPTAPAAVSESLDDQTRTEIDELIAEGNKIAAIKRLRDAVPGLGLAEAKTRVDTWGTASSSPEEPAHEFDADSLAEVDALIADEQFIPAIKLVRERTGWGLADAKRWVDARAGR